MAITVVETQVVQAAAASATITLANAVQAGDLLVAFVHTDGSTTIPSASDGTNGAYTQRASDSFFSSNPSAWLDFPNAAAVGAGLVITGTASGATKTSMHVWLIRGTSTAPFDVIAHQGAAGATSMTSGATAGVAGGAEIVMGGGDSANDTYTAGSGFTLDKQANDGATGIFGEHNIATLTGGSTQTATATQSGADSYYMFCAVYKGAVAAVTTAQILRATQRPYVARVRPRLFQPPFTPPPGVMPVVSYAFSSN